jgi:hypothetical protein
MFHLCINKLSANTSVQKGDVTFFTKYPVEFCEKTGDIHEIIGTGNIKKAEVGKWKEYKNLTKENFGFTDEETVTLIEYEISKSTKVFE